MMVRIRPIVWIEMAPSDAFTASQRTSPTAISAMGGPVSAMGRSLSVVSPACPRAPRRVKRALDACRSASVLDPGLVEPVGHVGRRVAVELRTGGQAQDVHRVVVDLVAPVGEVD